MRFQLQLLYKIIVFTQKELIIFFSCIYIKIVSYVFHIKHGTNFIIRGFPRFILEKGSEICFGNNYKMNSGSFFNPIGRNQRSLISVSKNGKLAVGNNVGMSSIAIICHKSIVIADNVRIGGNTVMYDTDFHSLNPHERTAIPEIKTNIKTKDICIGKNVFIGGHCTILKGTIIGENSIIGAGSVVATSIPANEIWGGNPVRFIAKINFE